MSTTPRFLTASEVARAAGVAVSLILRAVSEGKVVPAGRAGHSKNAAILFAASDVPAISAAIRGEAVAAAGKPHQCATLAEIEAKGAAFRRAATEGAQ